MPRFAEFAAATHVRDGVNHAAIEQAQAIGAEAHRDGDAVAAVSVEKQRRSAVPRRVAAIHNGKWNRRAIGRVGEEAFTLILRWIVAAEDGLLLAQDLFAAAEVKVKNRARRNERFVLETQMVGDKFGIRTERGIVDRFGKLDPMDGNKQVIGCFCQAGNRQARKSTLAFKQHQMR